MVCKYPRSSERKAVVTSTGLLSDVELDERSVCMTALDAPWSGCATTSSLEEGDTLNVRNGAQSSVRSGRRVRADSDTRTATVWFAAPTPMSSLGCLGRARSVSVSPSSRVLKSHNARVFSREMTYHRRPEKAADEIRPLARQVPRVLSRSRAPDRESVSTRPERAASTLRRASPP